MSDGAEFGEALRSYAMRLQMRPQREDEAGRKFDKAVAGGASPLEAGRAMLAELSYWTAGYPGPTPGDILDEIACAQGGGYAKGMISAMAAFPSVAELDRVWRSSPGLVTEALKRLGPARWDKITLTDPEAVAGLVLNEIVQRQRLEEIWQERRCQELAAAREGR